MVEGTLGLDSYSVEELLFQQLEVMNKALERTISLNLEISKRLYNKEGESQEGPSLTVEFEAQDGSAQSVLFTQANLGMDVKNNQTPLVVANVKGHAQELGCEDGWVLKAVAGESLAGMAFQDAFQVLRRKITDLRAAIQGARRSQTRESKQATAATAGGPMVDLKKPLLQQEAPLCLQNEAAAAPDDVAHHQVITHKDILDAQEPFFIKEYIVEDLYHKVGTAQAIARSPYFVMCSMMVIGLNLMFLAYDFDYDHSETLASAPLYILVISNMFCLYFLGEISIRYASFMDKRNAFKDYWFLFDLFLVLCMIWETWVMVLFPPNPSSGGSSYLKVLRVLRVLRIARVGALVRQAPQLCLFIKGIFRATSSVAATMALLVIIVYVFAIMFALLLSQSMAKDSSGTVFDAGQFEDVHTGFVYLLSQMICGPDADVIATMLEEGFVYYVLYLTCIVLGNMTVMNMLIGVLCGVVQETADSESLKMFEQDLDDHVGGLLRQLDTDGSGSLAPEELPALIHNEGFLQSLLDLEVDIPGMIEFAQYSMKSTGPITIDEFLDIVKDFRPGQASTAADIKQLRQYVFERFDKLEELLTRGPIR